MKKNIFLTLGITCTFILAIIVVLSSSNSGHFSVYALSAGSPGGKTGSPADGVTCTQCHPAGIQPFAPTSITSSGLSAGYTPGQTYTITTSISGTNSSKIGFEVTAERDANNAKTGTLVVTDVPRTKIVGGTAITHELAGTPATAGANSWSFDWVAPAAGTGNVTFYGAFNATNSNSSTSGDFVYTATFSVQEAITTEINENLMTSQVVVYPNPAKSFVNIPSQFNLVEVYNINGEKVLEEIQNQNRINVEHLSSGVYFIRLQGSDTIVQEKLIIQ